MANQALAAIRVLVIDDHTTMRKIIRRLLLQAGIINVDEAGDGQAALDHLRDPQKPKPDLILCDLHMDRMDGMEFCNTVRRDKFLHDRMPPIIVLTGEQESIALEVVSELGVALVVQKPISAPDLQLHIEQVVGFSS